MAVGPQGQSLGQAETRGSQVGSRAANLLPTVGAQLINGERAAGQQLDAAMRTAAHQQSQAAFQGAASNMSGPAAAQLCCVRHRLNAAKGMATPYLGALGEQIRSSPSLQAQLSGALG